MLQTGLGLTLAEGTQSLPTPVARRGKTGFDSFTALPTNIGAIEATIRFAEGTSPFVAIFGPSGWGKTHLLSAVERKLAETEESTVAIRSALTWTRSTTRQDLTPVLILDDLQDVFSHPRARHLVRQSIEYRVRTGRRTLVALTTDMPVRKLKSMLPFSGDWLWAAIAEPGIDERQLVVYQIASECQLHLSRPIARLIARHLNGNGRSIRGAIHRLRLVKRDWSKNLDVLPACGVLSPYLLGHEGWDPRDTVWEAVQRVCADRNLRLGEGEILSYLLLDDVGLSEGEVASFLKVTPAKAYQDCTKVRARCEDAEVKALLEACRIAVLCGFEEG